LSSSSAALALSPDMPSPPAFAVARTGTTFVGIRIDPVESPRGSGTEKWTRAIQSCNTREEIAAAINSPWLVSVSGRLSQLFEFEEDEPDNPAMEIESLRNMALFLLNQPSPTIPEISTSPDGLASCEWQLDQGGILAIEFLSHDMVRYAGVSGKTDDHGQRERISGFETRKHARTRVESFLQEQLA